MKTLRYFMITLFALTSLSAYSFNFSEVQVSYKKDDSGKKLVKLAWDEERQIVKGEMIFDWFSYDENMHGNGFDLDIHYKAYLNFPEQNNNCQIKNVTGKIQPVGVDKDSFMNFELHGPVCKSFLPYFKLMDVTLTLYEVPSLYNDSHTNVFRLMVMDAI